MVEQAVTRFRDKRRRLHAAFGLPDTPAPADAAGAAAGTGPGGRRPAPRVGAHEGKATALSDGARRGAPNDRGGGCRRGGGCAAPRAGAGGGDPGAAAAVQPARGPRTEPERARGGLRRARVPPQPRGVSGPPLGPASPPSRHTGRFASGSRPRVWLRACRAPGRCSGCGRQRRGFRPGPCNPGGLLCLLLCLRLCLLCLLRLRLRLRLLLRRLLRGSDQGRGMRGHAARGPRVRGTRL